MSLTYFESVPVETSLPFICCINIPNFKYVHKLRCPDSFYIYMECRNFNPRYHRHLSSLYLHNTNSVFTFYTEGNIFKPIVTLFEFIKKIFNLCYIYSLMIRSICIKISSSIFFNCSMFRSSFLFFYNNMSVSKLVTIIYKKKKLIF